MIKKYQVCVNCVMDTSDKDIDFDDKGICNHCRSYEKRLKSRIYTKEERDERLKNIVSKIKKQGKNQQYDCIVGVSGGVDSSYVAYLVKELGLRMYAIHFDNGWNSELATTNIKNSLQKLGVELHNYSVDWNEFKDLQKSFLFASTPDGEIPTDHAINAFLFKEASRLGIKYIISGMNFATESISVKSWAYGHSDWRYIKDVQMKFGHANLKTYPHFNLWNLFYWTFIERIKVISILNYIDYNKAEAMDLLKEKLDWVYYGGKHYESVYTRFYQGYILPEKFNIDKRRGHLSDLIYSKQITREEALNELKSEIYPRDLFKGDYELVLNKLSFSKEGFNKIMKSPTRSYKEFKNIDELIILLKKFVNFLRLKGLYSK